ncbi:MAG: MFS transporter [Synergistaceae bacterium]|nr:MFS transporter [Synergistaceae bacterium]
MVLLLVIIYLAFISLGLPDSLLGSAWPSMYGGLGVSIDSAGVISMIISGGTILSSLLSGQVIKRFGTGMVTLVSVAMTAGALIGFSLSGSFVTLCLCAVPLGLGAGSVDAALNNFVALHYKAKHMSWLHCFWGVGASGGPIIMSFSLARLQSWNAGYMAVGIIQLAFVSALLFSLPLWKKAQFPTGKNEGTHQEVLSLRQLIGLPGAKQALTAFFCYCSIETTVGLWGSSYLTTIRGIPAETAARWISLYFFGITFGRLLSGFLTAKLRHKQMVQLGQLLIGAGVTALLLPIQGNFILAALFLVGLGCAPIYPSLIHETPVNFGSRHSQAMIGVQMACAYVGTTFMPPLFGVLGARVSFKLFPFFIGLLLLLMIFLVMFLYKKTGGVDLS